MLTIASWASSRGNKPPEEWLVGAQDFLDRVGEEALGPWLIEALTGALSLDFKDLSRSILVYTPRWTFGQPEEIFVIYKGLLRLGGLLAEDPELTLAMAAYEAHEARLNAVVFDWTLAPFADFSRGGPNWENALCHAASAAASKPNGKWLTGAANMIESLGTVPLSAALSQLLAEASTLQWDKLAQLVEVKYRGFSYMFWSHRHLIRAADVLRGLLWFVPLLPPDDELTRQVATFTDASLRKADMGPLNPKCANAGVIALGALESEAALGHLARLAANVTFKVTLRIIEAALESIAEPRGVTRDELEEMAAPTFGLAEVGGLSVALDGTTAVMQVVGSKAELSFITGAGNTVKAAPATVKAYHGAKLAELKALAKDITKMLPAQTTRLDRLFSNGHSWNVEVWRQRYLDHPLVGTLARRLIWLADDVPVFWLDGELCTVDGAQLAINPEATIRLWHPVGRPLDEVVDWRHFIENRGLVQPFKQAHREVYLLTPAEEQTASYSNRFAGHVLRQHQFHALASARGWHNSLRVMADAEFPPATKTLRAHGIRAEYWVEGFGWDAEVVESGAYVHIGTDQVRFYPIDAPQAKAHAGGGGYSASYAEPPVDSLPLSEIDPLVLSEVLRDIDLFVGVASVGGDPSWSDGGPEGRHREYWEAFSFGALSVSAAQRRDLLSRIVPRLAIADKCRLTDRFLEVDGALHSYKIHLGSGNVLMSPNDSYLCIVASSRAAIKDPLQLPFDGDRTLSIILSKAVMLAADDKITDGSILGQFASVQTG